MAKEIKTIYISLPITGYDLAERRDLAERARRRLRERHPGARVISPFDIADVIEAEKPEPLYSDYMKEDVALILDEADAVCFLVNPRLTRSKGVRLEYQTARIYGRRMMRIRPGRRPALGKTLRSIAGVLSGGGRDLLSACPESR